MNGKKRVLFLCVGNACRSQMAEGFARTYGSDVIESWSAGLGPAEHVAIDTIRAMDEKNIDIRDYRPKGLTDIGRSDFDLVVNMSGFTLPELPRVEVREWDVEDPIAMRYDEHCKIRDEIERLVMMLVLELRRRK